MIKSITCAAALVFALSPLAGTASAESTASSSVASAGTAQAAGGVAEPASWMLIVVGFGVLGASMRRRPAAGVLTRL